MSESNLDLVQNPVIEAFIREQTKFPEDFKLNICENDEMYLFALSNVKDDRDRALVRYYSLGRRILDTVKQVVDWHFGSFENVPSFLDFACGYGRFTRFLIQEMPPEQVWVSDIYANAVKFQAEYFGVSGIVSTGKPENYLIDRKFDCILANSFFSHMPERTFTSWLQNLYDLLTPNGILMFSVHDECLRAPNVEMPANGILFSALSESQSLDKEEYGTTYVTEKFVREVVDKVSAGKAFVHRIEKGICRFQDLYVVTNQLSRDFSELKFNQHPEGYVDVAAFTNKENLYLEGWAADLNGGGKIEDLQVLVNGEFVQRCEPFYDRPDVAGHFETDVALQSGWNCYLPKNSVAPQDVLTVKAINNYGLTWILETCTVQSLVRQKQSRSLLGSTQLKLQLVETQLAGAKIEWEQSQSKLMITETQLEESHTKLEETQNQLISVHSQLEQTQSQLVSLQMQLEKTENQLMNVKQELEKSQCRVVAMESSKFWKLRSTWFQVRRALGLAGE
ncbi:MULTISPECIES: class I SAM-dependent methyltransferase [unclassified Microcoleus]|uniref:class I SAM-dependent methyltransferase n=1 Tax=unclassified Microcoleus TaxID=2642155 RepID=UPI001DA26BFF|nr:MULTISPECIES: class I SAM-dependent methyltransferase [unclassified Microcoleus]MCC3442644.1 methyltransferase domain-containing protein [Microcoleus sp. PH2017_03_ELD_O_A]MCC3502848.1 methyltransferase domain-containing protein [Microcoleus sp. PH2017_19_SFW_U_A]TAE43052.1 MAG: methyltransferase domain-containing protein [Oscillatoriales cyanobacterium]MCC3521680.1 methyltransferase domain-containing protein [Microcoleus sp. PH2017_20_SFW_D_A]MCC3534722.1 methyltransferase domain-containin